MAGITTRRIMSDVRETLASQLEKDLERLPFQPKIRLAVLDGFKDGMSALQRTLAEMKIIEYVEEPSGDADRDQGADPGNPGRVRSDQRP